jgi:protein involved in temperature-dependent protein secretion
MSVEAAIEQGDFQGALNHLVQETSGPAADPARLLMRFNMEVRLQQFDAAQVSMRRLVAAAPQMEPVMARFAAAAQAEALVSQRRRDPALAGKRASVGIPPTHLLALAQASVAHASGDAQGAKAALAQATSMTPPTTGTLTRVNGATQRFTAIADSNELTGASLLVYDGPNVLDLAFSELVSIVFHDPKTSLDVMWSVAEIETTDGRRIHGRIPSFYAGTGLADSGHVRTGQMTTWERGRGYAEALGQRDWAVTLEGGGQTMVGILGVRRVDFNNPRRAQVGPGGLGHGSGGTFMPGFAPGGQASPAAESIRSIGGTTVTVLYARAAIPLIFRLLGAIGFGFGAAWMYELLRNGLALAGIILYFVWFSRFYGWVRAQRGGTAYSTGFAIGSWFIPFANFVMPYLALNDAAKRTLGQAAPIVGAWWACYLVSTLLAIFFSVTAGGPLPFDNIAVLEALSWLSTLTQIGAYGLLAMIVKDLTARVQ